MANNTQIEYDALYSPVSYRFPHANNYHPERDIPYRFPSDAKRDFSFATPFVPFRRLDKYTMSGAVGRIFPADNLMQMDQDVADLGGNRKEEVYIHEVGHLQNYGASEKDNRFNTKLKLKNPHYH